MARPISWLPRLHEIRRAVNNSVRSHYTRDELEFLFQLRPRATAKLMELFPIDKVGNTYTVSREQLSGVLARFQETDDPHALLAQLREEKAGLSRRKIRHMVLRDVAPATLASLPTSMTLEPGRMEVRFATVTELGEAMLFLALVLESDGDEFARRYEPAPPKAEDTDAAAVRALFTELEEMELAHGKR
jgi:hypothetical protein